MHFALLFNAQQHSAGIRDCDNAIDGSCPHCSPQQPCICCDLCNPEEFEDMFWVPNLHSKSQPCRSKIKDYTPDNNDKTLQEWLKDWRRKTSKDIYGVHCVKHFGYLNVVADSTLDQICDAAHQHLISSTNDLFKETHWHLTNEFGQTIVDQIKEVIPAAPPPLKTTATRKCSQCGQPRITVSTLQRIYPTHILVISIRRTFVVLPEV